MENEDETLCRGLAELNLSDRSGLSSLLLKYIEEIELFNSAYGLVKAANRRELIVKHILDSLSPFSIIARLLNDRPGPGQEARRRIADVGSGAGLPGIPLAMVFPDAEFTLIERMGRRAGFLRNCAAVLGLANVNVEETAMEEALPHRFDLAVFRAFRPLEGAVIKNLLRLVKPVSEGNANPKGLITDRRSEGSEGNANPKGLITDRRSEGSEGGCLAAWKGRLEKTRKETAAVKNSFPGLKQEIIPLTVPFLDEERCLLIISSLTGYTTAVSCGQDGILGRN